jgi:hypothetical protein
MKKHLIYLAIFLLGCSVTVNAQIAVGVKVGTNVNKITGSGFSDKFTYNYNVGGYLRLPLGKKLSIQPEVILTQNTATTGTNFSNLYSGNGASAQSNLKTNKLNTLAIPILLNYGSGSFKWQGGVQYAKLIDKSKTLLQNGESAFKAGDFSLVGGAWLKLPFHLNVSARYLVGLNNVSDITNNNKWKNQAIQFAIGYQF